MKVEDIEVEIVELAEETEMKEEDKMEAEMRIDEAID